MATEKKIGIVGASGAVGREIIEVLHDLSFPIAELHLFASERSAGLAIATPYGQKVVRLFSVSSVRDMDIVFMAVSGSFSLQYVPEIVANNGPIVIDNSSAFRYQKDIPLVVPEINGADIGTSKIIANPNCTTAIAAMVLYPIYCHYGIRNLIVSTYQAASGAGEKGIRELLEGTEEMLQHKTPEPKIFAHPLPFNIIPHIDDFQENGYTKEEMKVSWETKKIFHDDSIAVACTAVRIPTRRAHAESIAIETLVPVTVDGIKEIMREAPGVELLDNPKENVYPMPMTASQKQNVQVGRIRQSIVYGDKGIELFVCGDQLLRGAALNAVLIAKYIVYPTEMDTYKKVEQYPIHEIKKREKNTDGNDTCIKQAQHLGYIAAFGALVSGATFLLAKKKSG